MKIEFSRDFGAALETDVPDLSSAYPLVLDLDGTLFRTDLLLEAILRYVKRQPLGIMLLLCWACRGIAHLKHRLALRTTLCAELLPVNEPLVSYAREAAARGRTVVAATAANRDLAEKVCARFGFIGEVIGSSHTTNLKGATKAAALRVRFPNGFAYAGDSSADIAVWRHATFGIFAGRNPGVRRSFASVTALEADFSSSSPRLKDWVAACRPHQWAKNSLIFLPLMLAGHLANATGWICSAGAFAAMCLVASATYVINDLLDLDADRQHWSKRKRPFASGTIGIGEGAIGGAILLTAGLAIGYGSGGISVLATLLLYCALTLAYSLHLKRVPILDVTLLAVLFTMRLVTGAVAAQVRLSSWLAVFSMFLFFSLALAKRSTEISHKAAASAAPHGRGYVPADANLVASLGASSALGAVLVLVLYLIDEAFVGTLYRSPQLLWAAPVLMGLWLGRIWLLCGRGLLHDDPVAFAVTDRTSIGLGLGVFATFVGAAFVP